MEIKLAAKIQERVYTTSKNPRFLIIRIFTKLRIFNGDSLGNHSLRERIATPERVDPYIGRESDKINDCLIFQHNIIILNIS